MAEEVEAAAVLGKPAAHPWAAGLAALDAFQEPGLRAAALLLRARVAEGAGCTGQARALVDQCLAVVPGLLPAVRDAAEQGHHRVIRKCGVRRELPLTLVLRGTSVAVPVRHQDVKAHRGARSGTRNVTCPRLIPVTSE